jgi:hypothetical protein
MVSFGDLQIGSLLGKYRIDREIGRGGMGVVYLATDTDLGRQVALKVLLPSLSGDEEFLARFRIEARAIAAFNHPGVVSIHAFSFIDDRALIDMEYVNGGSLLRCMNNGGLSAASTLSMANGVLDCLAFGHTRHIIHRDIKPSNILFNESSTPKLVDFGLAKCQFELQDLNVNTSSSRIFLGTPLYACPESWDKAPPTPAADVYSLGVVLFHCLAGEPPYLEENPLSLIRAIVTDGPPSLKTKKPDLSDELCALVRDMIRRDPERRIQTARDAQDRLHAVPEFGGAEIASARTIAGLPPERRPWQWRAPRLRFRLRYVVSLVVLVALFVGIAWFLQPTVDAPSQLPLNDRHYSYQRDAFFAELPYPDDLLQLRKMGGWTVYNSWVQETGTAYPDHFMIRHRQGEREGEFVAFTSKKIWYGSCERVDQALTLNGHWAHYEGEDNAFHHGTIAGEGVAVGPNTTTLTLNFTGSATLTRTLTLGRADITDTRLIWKAENANEIQELLYNRVLPAGLPWGAAVDSVFPCQIRGRIRVPYASGLDNSVTLDGRLDESEWSTQYVQNESVDPLGVLAGSPGPVLPELLVRYSDDALYLGINTYNPLPLETAGITIGLLRRFSIPVWQSERWIWIHEGGVRTQGDYRGAGGNRVPWNSRWQAKTGLSEGLMSAECRIPYDDLGSAGAPRPGDRWRLNVQISDLARDSENTVMQWGYIFPAQLEHGVILVFEDLPPTG